MVSAVGLKTLDTHPRPSLDSSTYHRHELEHVDWYHLQSMSHQEPISMLRLSPSPSEILEEEATHYFQGSQNPVGKGQACN